MLNHNRTSLLLATTLLILSSLAFTSNVFADVKAGDTVQTLVNLHPDANRMTVYTMNYQIAGVLIPVCSEITIKKVKKKKMVFEWKGMEYTMAWDKHTKRAGLSLMDVANTFFGESCDKAKIDRMSEVDRKGIRLGEPAVGMTREGILIAMGPPPKHANPDPDASSYMYWKNRFAKKAVDFNEKGKVIEVR